MADVLPLAEVKMNLRLSPDATDEDDYLSGLIAAAEGHVEAETYLILAAREVIERHDAGVAIRLRAWPVQEDEDVAISYRDPRGVAGTVEGATVDAAAWPAVLIAPTLPTGAVLTLTYWAGFTSPSLVPRPVKQAMQLLVAHWYQNREAVMVGGSAAAVTVPLGVDALLRPWKAWAV